MRLRENCERFDKQSVLTLGDFDKIIEAFQKFNEAMQQIWTVSPERQENATDENQRPDSAVQSE